MFKALRLKADEEITMAANTIVVTQPQSVTKPEYEHDIPTVDREFLRELKRRTLPAVRRIEQGGDAAEEQERIMALGWHLQKSRLQLGKSPEDISRLLGLTPKDLCLAETGHIEPEKFDGLLERWARLLGLDPREMTDPDSLSQMIQARYEALDDELLETLNDIGNGRTE